MKEFRAALLYLAVLVPAAAVAVLIESFAIGMVGALPHVERFRNLVGWALNLLPALACGFVLFFPVAWWVARRWRRPGLAAHVARAAPLYIVTLAVGTVIWVNFNNGDFWLAGQLVLWPGAAALGGALADLGAGAASPKQGA